MSAERDVAAVRTSVTLLDSAHLACVRVAGGGAHELLDRVSPRQLFVRSGQMLHTLLLDDAAKPIADVYICCDDECYVVIAEGMSGAAIVAYLRDHGSGLEVELVDVSATHALISLDGPYSWELLAEVTSPDVIGLPYLGFFHDRQFTCFRAGKTGEYGYDLLIARDRLTDVRARFVDVGRRFDLHVIGPEPYALCMLEAGFFRIGHASCTDLTPVELQLQWRIANGRVFPGSMAIAAHRRSPRGRAVYIASDHELAQDATVELDGRRIGHVIDHGRSFTRGAWLGVALLEPGLGYAGLTDLTCGGAAVRTISAPAVNNRSLYVDPQRHSYATRAATTFPALVRPSWS